MITLIYASSATHEMTQEDLIDLLATSKDNNQALDVTGILLYRSGNFLQVLEGKKEVVKALYEKIKKDPRHHTVMTILERPLAEREFDDWEMGFVNLDIVSDDQMPEGFNDFLLHPFEEDGVLGEKSPYVSIFLHNFKELMV
ncbi:MAG: BLUF domain-containing protein [Phototrophicaceae bacterium]